MTTRIADLDSIIQVIVAETHLTSRQGTVMRGLVREIPYPEGSGSPWDRPKLGKLGASSLTEGLPIAAAQRLTDTDVSINPAEVGLQTVLTDTMLKRAHGGFVLQVAEEHSRAYGEKLDKDLLGLFSGLGNGLSSTSNALTLGNIGAGRARVKGASEPGPDPIFMVLHTYQAWDIQSSIIPIQDTTTATYSSAGRLSAGGPVMAADQILRTGMLGTLFGIPVLESGLISVDSSDDAYGAVFSKEAFILLTVDEGSMRPQRFEAQRATELNFVGEYGFGEWVDSYGYYLLTDASAPTA